MIRSGHIDTFTRDHLPPRAQWPDLVFTLPTLRYPERLNAVSALLDHWLEAGAGDRACVISGHGTISFRAVAERVNRLANVLTRELGMVSGNRVLIRGANSPMVFIAVLAVIKAGGVIVPTMPLLRARELGLIIAKAKIKLALCDASLSDELERAAEAVGGLEVIGYWNSGTAADLEALMATSGHDRFDACDTAADDVCAIGFTSGTTGEPKGAMHFHRDLLATCDTYGAHVLHATREDRFIGTPPIAFSYGFGGLMLFPLRVGASAIMLERATPDDLLEAISRFRATVCFTAPTAYRAMLPKLDTSDVSSLRACVSAGETLPAAIFEEWRAKTGLPIMDGLGSTEMLHIFVGSPADQARAGSTGQVVPGYEARLVDEFGHEVPSGQIGRLAVRGPTGCRYLADARQTIYVVNGWNITGDTYVRDDAGYFWYQARSDDMIVSAGYNIAGPEVEAALLTHPLVTECGVVGAPDRERGQIVKAFVVLRDQEQAGETLVRALQDHVKATIAPYKYPRAIEFVSTLPRTGTGKLQRFELRRRAAEKKT
ncbi:MAG: benzoate-CoA ligase family protein [Alphaproteobacteria bacterium]|nr:benzoate-CoA ligase family protein [Alphaproteobacteria bacterium]